MSASGIVAYEPGSGGSAPVIRALSKPDSRLAVVGDSVSRGPRYFLSNPGGPRALNVGESPAARASFSSGRLDKAGKPNSALIVSITALWSPSACDTACTHA